MGIKCALGLVACLSYQGASITEDNVFGIRLSCQEIVSFPAYTFLLNSSPNRGYMLMDYLENIGLNVIWKPNYEVSQEQLARFRKLEVEKACVEFFRVSNNSANWSR